MDSSSDFLQLRKRAIVCCAFAAALSTVSAYMLSGGNRISGFVIIAVQAFLIVFAARYLIMMKRTSKAS
jgi:hypothetical protein